MEQFQTKPKTKDYSFVKKSLRQLNKDWIKSTIEKGRHKTKLLYIDKLFNIGINIDSLTDNEASFYTDQLGYRCGCISKDVNLKYAVLCFIPDNIKSMLHFDANLWRPACVYFSIFQSPLFFFEAIVFFFLRGPPKY